MLISQKPTAVRMRCKQGLREAFGRINPSVPVDSKGYVDRTQDNLLHGIPLDAIDAEFGAGAGGELKGKMRALHSSSALGVNVFAPIRSSGTTISLAGEHGLRLAGFEVKMPTGVIGRTPPHLDVMLANEAATVAIESKCTEYMCPKQPHFSDEYEEQIIDQRRDGAWFAEMLRIKRSAGHGYRFLDAAQLIKHAFGLSHRADERRAVLLYIFWEPRDANLSPLFRQHRMEIDHFAARVAGDRLRFASMTYSDLWDDWLASDSDFLREHAGRLRDRYWFPACSGEAAIRDGESFNQDRYRDRN